MHHLLMDFESFPSPTSPRPGYFGRSLRGGVATEAMAPFHRYIGNSEMATLLACGPVLACQIWQGLCPCLPLSSGEQIKKRGIVKNWPVLAMPYLSSICLPKKICVQPRIYYPALPSAMIGRWEKSPARI